MLVLNSFVIVKFLFYVILKTDMKIFSLPPKVVCPRCLKETPKTVTNCLNCFGDVRGAKQSSPPPPLTPMGRAKALFRKIDEDWASAQSSV